jgi:hypothetical protein
MPLSNKQLGNTFIQGQNIIIYPSGNSYVISKPDTESYGATGVVGAGQDSFPEAILGVDYFVPIYLFQDLSGPNSTMIYKSFSAGTGIGIIDSNNTLIFTAITPTINGLTSFTSAGTGNILLLSTAITSNTLFYKTLSGTSNLSVNDDNNGTLTFSFAGSGAGTIISGIPLGWSIVMPLEVFKSSNIIELLKPYGSSHERAFSLLSTRVIATTKLSVAGCMRPLSRAFFNFLMLKLSN